MVPTNDAVDSLRNELHDLRDEASSFFDGMADIVEARFGKPKDTEAHRVQWERRLKPAWDDLSDQQKATAKGLRLRLTEFGNRFLQAVRISALMDQADENHVRRSLRRMAAALVLHEYQYSDPYVVSEEDKVFGIVPAEQSESRSEPPACRRIFSDEATRLLDIMDLLAPAPDQLAQAIVASQSPSIQKFRPNTAFIIMQIDPNIPILEDVKNSIKEVFREFNVDALRSDEIEHLDVITQRILDEIVTSEFLIADLTGERPSVYYELGYAHAAGKRPILYRQEGTRLHFDLLVHNVPEYRNTTDLKQKLRTRLAAITGKLPKQT
jgi:hypothetical protein